MTKRIYELAKELNVSSKDLVSAAEKAGMDVKNHMSTIDDNAVKTLTNAVKPAAKPAPKAEKKAEAPKKPAQNAQAAPKAAQNNGGNNQNRKNNQGNQNRSNNNGNGNQGGNRNNNNNRNNNRGGNNNGRPNNNWNGNNRNNKKGKKGPGRNRNNENRPAPTVRKDQPLPETLVYSVGMNVQDIAKLIHRDATEIIKKLFMLGVMVNQNQSLDADTIEILAADYGIEAEQKVEVDIADIDKFFEEEQENTENLAPRAPVVTIMGHVDHGKTTLLDYLRNSHVTEGEAGGITQHIGAYQVKTDEGRVITFLDTPGHAAFTAMRARGADITDITILVVAADDGVMPQTIEAINHAKAAGTPIIVAVNKIDKPGANPENVINQLMQYELIPEEYGGDTIFVNISAKFGQNIDELLEMILLTADVMDLQANPDQRAAGSVIEARLDKGRGTIATVLVQQGTMRVGDPIVVGNTYGRVRTMTNDRGRRVKEAVPSTPVEITGLNDVPSAGDRFVVFEDEKTARAAGEERAKRALIAERNRNNVVSVSDLFNKMAEKQMKSVPVIIKADVQGSVEALAGSFRKIDVDGVKVDILHTAVGAINESDVTLAEASGAIIIGFNVRPTPQAKQQADADKVDIRLHNVIYNAIDEIEAAMKGQLDPEFREEIVGTADVRELFKVSKIGTIVGGMVTSGKITRNSSVRLIRDGIVIYDGKLASLRRFKDDVKEVKNGYDFGLTIENYNDEKIGDVIEAYEMVEIPR
ncbi:translation initiation factor IF-2 [Weissella confusa]|uniref:translation initiation factor IF-2 n=1 Tax=Weissella confusa TaxID=1583 RepID=UPI000246665E|nr:translation initiation factor IF-2 [Weissella confusa]MBJ7615953.1 translation initiation factor IF-2 [Weissella confusa]MBJ7626135.1 translation initiation factor IF-2 [Weissella confusa]MBJ7690413.1 translation initiation factor IF-2 [Weissella confusa]MBJ7700660.1 translation initiation factor IF-2 [Weissella confusa]MDY2512237.1 translation initiation factor IF-2 [Weissella confusa]